MKTSALSTRQSILLISMWAEEPTAPSDGDLMRLSACEYIAPKGPQGKWALTGKGVQRVMHMTGQDEIFDAKATQAVIDFLKKAALVAWAKNLPITGDEPSDILRLQKAIGEYIQQGARFNSLSAWGDNPTGEDLCALLCHGLADVSRSQLVDWAAVYDLFREVEI